MIQKWRQLRWTWNWTLSLNAGLNLKAAMWMVFRRVVSTYMAYPTRKSPKRYVFVLGRCNIFRDVYLAANLLVFAESLLLKGIKTGTASCIWAAGKTIAKATYAAKWLGRFCLTEEWDVAYIGILCSELSLHCCSILNAFLKLVLNPFEQVFQFILFQIPFSDLSSRSVLHPYCACFWVYQPTLPK